MAVKKNNMDTIFEQDKHMLTFMEGVEKGELDYHLAIDNLRLHRDIVDTGIRSHMH